MGGSRTNPALAAGAWRIEADLTAVGLRVSHLATCPEVAPAECAVEPIPPHQHKLSVAWSRLRASATVGLGRGFQVGLDLPLDVRRVDATYLALDGSPFDPPYADIHHRDEWIAGPADGQVALARYAVLGRVSAGLYTGATLPWGRTEEDPFAAADAGLSHQHHQLGAGVPLWVAGGNAVYLGDWGAAASLDARVPVAENSRGYRAPLSVAGRAGPTRALWRGGRAFLAGDLLYEAPERWSGQPHGGRTAALVDAALAHTWPSAWTLWTEVRVPVWQRLTVSAGEEDEDGSFRQWPLLGVGFSRTFPSLSPRADPGSIAAQPY